MVNFPVDGHDAVDVRDVVDVLDVGREDTDEPAEILAGARRHLPAGMRGAVAVGLTGAVAALALGSLRQHHHAPPPPAEIRTAAPVVTESETVIAVSPQVGAALLRSPACQASRFCELVPTAPRRPTASLAAFSGRAGTGRITEAIVTSTDNRVIGQGTELALPDGAVVRLTAVLAVARSAPRAAPASATAEGVTTTIALRRGGWDLSAVLIVAPSAVPPVAAARAWLASSPLPG